MRLWPLCSAICKAVFPFLFLDFTLLPASINNLTISICPEKAATCSEVVPSLLCTLISLPALISESVIPVCPFAAAIYILI